MIERPVIIVSTPRAGSTMLFEALARAPGIYTVGGESHAVIEGIPALTAQSRGWESNRLIAADATAAVARKLVARFHVALRDRSHRRPSGPVRMLEKTPRNALRVPFLHAVFPDAFFIYLHRDPRDTISSMLDAWRSRRFVTYPELPGWSGPPWSLLLVPGWRALAGRPLAEIVAAQWATATRILLDDLEAVPPSQRCTASYERLAAAPAEEIARLCALAGLAWDGELPARLPISRSALTPPDPGKAQRNAAELDAVLPAVAGVAARGRILIACDTP